MIRSYNVPKVAMPQAMRLCLGQGWLNVSQCPRPYVRVTVRVWGVSMHANPQCTHYNRPTFDRGTVSLFVFNEKNFQWRGININIASLSLQLSSFCDTCRKNKKDKSYKLCEYMAKTSMEKRKLPSITGIITRHVAIRLLSSLWHLSNWLIYSYDVQNKKEHGGHLENLGHLQSP